MNQIDYELSMWETQDRFLISTSDGDKVVDTLSGIDYSYTLVNEYTEEVRIAVISNSNEFESPLNAFNINLTQNINGTNELEFSIQYKYYRDEDDQMAINPYVNYLLPGRQLKLRYDYERDDNGALLYDSNGDKIPIWYDLVVKTTSESQEDNAITYTASDSNIDELSRNGYSIELDTELENNMGSITELATQILDNVDWTVVDTEDGIELPTGQTLKSNLIKSTNNEVLYKYTIPAGTPDITATVMDDYEYNGQEWEKGDTITLTSGTVVYISSTCYLNQRTPHVFLYNAGTYITDTDGTILNSPNWSATFPIVYGTTTLYIDSYYRGNMLSLSDTTKYVSIVESACSQYQRIEEYYQIDTTAVTAPVRGTPYYTKAGSSYYLFTGSAWESGVTYYSTRRAQTAGLDQVTNKYYSYDTKEYPSTTSIRELLGTQTDFTNNSGWESSKVTKQTINIPTSTGATTYTAASILKIDFTIDNSTSTPPSPAQWCWNNGINSCKTQLSSNNTELFTKGQTFIVALNTQNSLNSIFTNVEIRGINSNTSDQQLVTIATGVALPDTGQEGRPYCPELDGFKLFRLTVQTSINYQDGVSYWRFYTYFGTNDTSSSRSNVQLKYCTMFKETYTTTTVNGATINYLVVPNLGKSVANLIKTRHNIFRQDYKDFMSFAVDKSTLIFQDVCYDDEITDASHEYTVIRNENYEKITSITESQSNYYNLIQTLCETFECWSKYVVAHNSQGQILYKYRLTNDTVPLAGKRYYKLRSGSVPSGYFHDDAYTLKKISDFYKVNTDTTYNPALTYYTKVSDTLFIDANLGYQWYGFQTNYWTREYDATTKTTTFNQCTAQSVYSASTQYYTYIVGALTAVAVKDTFNSETYGNYWLVDTNVFNSSSIYEKQYQKFLAFKQYSGRYNDAGFRYGINLNGITRKVVGDAICTKLYVPSLDTELNEDGICTIQKADSNFSGETAIYNFQYYIHNGLLDAINFNRDLYGDETGGIAYLTMLHDWNQKVNQTNEELILVAEALNNIQSYYTTNNTTLESARSNYSDMLTKIKNALGLATESEAAQRQIQSTDNTQVISYLQQRDEASNIINTCNNWNDTYKSQLDEYQTRYNNLVANTLDTANKKTTLMNEFYRKYSQVIKEGTWSANEYYDHNMYYSDALQIANTSAFPQVEYDLEAAEVSQIDGYSAYNFKVGDKTYIEDVEFFGYDSVTKKPYQEEVIVSEIKRCLDNPSENTITIQNYKTQFQDLFQRVSASVQSYETNKNAYIVAASTVSNLTASAALVQRILDTNNTTIRNAAQQTVTLDETGLTIVDDVSPMLMLRGIGKGIYLSSDGGDNWTSAITSSGINAEAITAGSVDTSRIRIIDGNYVTFQWNDAGLTAYKTESSTGINTNYFVRFDSNGVYGCNGNATLAQGHPSIEAIKNYATFSLTWDGFTLNNTKDNNWVNITSIERGAQDSKASTAHILYPGSSGTLPDPVETYGSIDTYYYTYDSSSSQYKRSTTYTGGVSWSGAPILYYAISQTSSLHRVISAGTTENGVKQLNFAVYEDGSILANDGDFKGTIYAQALIDASTGNKIFGDGRTISSTYVTTTACFG